MTTAGGPRVGQGGRVARGPGPDAFRGRSRLERAVLPFLREQTLWPVLAVVVVHFVLLGAPLLVSVWRSARAGSIAGLSLLAAASALAVAVESRSRGGPRAVSALILAIWLLCIAAAVAAVRLELL